MHPYKNFIQDVRKGVAILKVDDDIRLWTRQKVGPGYQIEGHREIKHLDHDGSNPHKRTAGIIIKAKLDHDWACPRDLNRMKVFYKFYRDHDQNGCYRPYLFIAARSDDAQYRGKRVVCISDHGATLLLEPHRFQLGNILRDHWFSIVPLPGETIAEAYERKY